MLEEIERELVPGGHSQPLPKVERLRTFAQYKRVKQLGVNGSPQVRGPLDGDDRDFRHRNDPNSPFYSEKLQVRYTFTR